MTRELEIYLALQTAAPTTATEIARKTGANRRTVTNVLNRLRDEGIVDFEIDDTPFRDQAGRPPRYWRCTGGSS